MMAQVNETLDALSNTWKSCQAQDDQKQTLIEGLFAYIKDLSEKLSGAEIELDERKDLFKLNRDRWQKSDEQVKALQREKERHAYVAVLMDGDGIHFNDEFVKQGMDGGKRAAYLLKKGIENQVHSFDPPLPHHANIVIRVYANLRGLAKIYKDADILPDVWTLLDFIRGFNMGGAMFGYVDAGDGKDCSDEKIRAQFRHDFADVHCKRILLGGSADGGFMRLLDEIVESETDRKKIVLLRGPPFVRELAQVKDRFHVMTIDAVFRNEKLVAVKRKVSFHATPPSTPSVGYATAATKTSVTPIVLEAKPGEENPKTSSKVIKRQVLRNKRGQRVDAAIHYAPQDFLALKSRRLCNSFHILGTCMWQDTYGNCSHKHGEKLSYQQVEALRAVSRQSVCKFGSDCNDADCLDGHRCTRDGCTGGGCKFPMGMHGIDTKVDIKAA